MAFRTGWNPDFAAAADEHVRATTGYATVRAELPIPESAYILPYRDMAQGDAGTCHIHAAVAVVEDTALANGLDVFKISRRLVGWAAGQLTGGGNPSDGGSPTMDAVAMSNLRNGVGVAHESLCPYTDDYATLGTQPDPSVFADAKAVHVLQPVAVSTTDDDDAFRLISNNHAVWNGIWWPFGWDAQQTFMSTIGRGKLGHALQEKGYALPGVLDKYGWVCLRNWHGLLYPPLPLEMRAKIAGYPAVMPNRVSEFWVRQDILATVRARDRSERGAATSITGLNSLINLAGVLSNII